MPLPPADLDALESAIAIRLAQVQGILNFLAREGDERAARMAPLVRQVVRASCAWGIDRSWLEDLTARAQQCELEHPEAAVRLQVALAVHGGIVANPAGRPT